MNKIKLLLVDDEAPQREMLAGWLEKQGFEVRQASSGEEALQAYPSFFCPVAVIDMKMPGMGGIELIGRLKGINPYLQIIVLTAFGSVETAVTAMKAGAWHYQTKPVELEELLINIRKAAEQYRLISDHAILNETVRERFGSGEIIGQSKAIQQVLELINLAAPGDSNILITGSSGTGKELAARAIHSLSFRKERPFVAVNCAALPENLLESELFGYEKGAFTGAIKRKLGRFELADQGTIFLDEIGDMDMAMQAKLLRVIENHEIERLGGEKAITLNVRLICATNKILDDLVREGKFREDLFYRINVVAVHMPPLAERAGDTLLLADKFLREFSRKMGKNIISISAEAASALTGYDWPGNVRELQNIIERAVVLARGEAITLKELPGLKPVEDVSHAEEGVRLADMEKRHIKKILDTNGWNIGQSAEILGIHRNTLRMKINEYGLREEAS